MQYTLIIAFDGTRYTGWQQQPRAISIAETLQKVFLRVFKKPVWILGASRTDAGVHALGQVVFLRTDFFIQAHILKKALSDILPPDIVIRSAIVATDDFHPWYCVAQKTYYYHFFTRQPLPFIARYGWHYPYAVDYQKLQAALALFVGTHDFRSFVCAEDERVEMERTIDAINLSYIRRYGVYRIEVRGKKFLRHMIRRIVGAALYVASHKNVSICAISAILNKKDPRHNMPTAPAHGLLLRKIVYEKK